VSDSRREPASSGAPATEFRSRTRIVSGLGCVPARLAAELDGLGTGPVAVVADRGFAAVGLLDQMLAAAAGHELPVCALIDVDPDIAAAEAAASAALEEGARAVLAVGGGSALCAAKAVAIRLTNPAPLDAYAGRDRLPQAPARCIAIPTTAGSGSEVSTVVVLHDPHHEQHLVIRGRGYEPDLALLDGTVLRSLPERPMVEAALDALSHCYEALWSRQASRFTDAMALAAASELRDSLPAALEGDEAAMQALIEASAMANLACGNAGLALVHALSSAPTVRLSHGYQNGVLLPHVAAFNLPVLEGAAAAEISQLPEFLERIGFRARFDPGELSETDAEAMVTAALANPFTANNRRPAGEAELRELLAAAAG
jgi:alcohol dehydrogenase class IV